MADVAQTDAARTKTVADPLAGEPTVLPVAREPFIPRCGDGLAVVIEGGEAQDLYHGLPVGRLLSAENGESVFSASLVVATHMMMALRAWSLDASTAPRSPVAGPARTSPRL